MLFPRIGVMDWKQSQRASPGAPWCCLPWASAWVCAAADQGRWLAGAAHCEQPGPANGLGLRDPDAAVGLPDRHPPGLRQRHSLASTMIPIVISVLPPCRHRHQRRGHDDDPAVRGELRLHPAGERTAEHDCLRHRHLRARDFVRTGIVITLAAVVLLVVFALTYWPWLGLMVTRA